MKHYDNNIDMFDAYLNGAMSSDDCAAFEKMLSEDKALKQEFKQHKEFLFALQTACGDADAEFENALKNVSDEEMKNIVTAGKSQASSLADGEAKPKGKVVPLKSVIRWMSAAAAILLVVGVGTHQFMKNKSQNQLYDAIAGTHEFATVDVTRGSSDDEQVKEDYDNAIQLIEQGDCEKAIKLLESTIKDHPESELVVDCGTPLAYAYVKIHDIDNAKRVIEETKKAAKAHERDVPEGIIKLDKQLSEL